MWQTLLIALPGEIGLFLVLFPWSDAWTQNWVVDATGLLRSVLLNHYLRGAISGLGLVNLWVAISQAWDLLRPRAAAHTQGPNAQ